MKGGGHRAGVFGKSIPDGEHSKSQAGLGQRMSRVLGAANPAGHRRRSWGTARAPVQARTKVHVAHTMVCTWGFKGHEKVQATGPGEAVNTRQRERLGCGGGGPSRTHLHSSAGMAKVRRRGSGNQRQDSGCIGRSEGPTGFGFRMQRNQTRSCQATPSPGQYTTRRASLPHPSSCYPETSLHPALPQSLPSPR